jgi:hypothetical protein
MSKWNGNIISKDARYRTQTGSQSRGVYSLDEQLQHVNASNWQSPFNGFPDNDGQRVAITITPDTTTADSTSAFNVHHEDFDSAYAEGSVGRLYIAIKVTADPAYYNDFCIGAIQLTSDDYSTLEHGWSFNVIADYTDWEYATVTGLNTTSAGYENYNDIIGAPSQSWAACINNVANARISRASGTVSSYTGAADGLASEYSDSSTGTIIGSGTSTIAQSSTTSYMFTESSGASGNLINKWYWIRSAEITMNSEADKNIAICYLAATHSSQGMQDASDNALFRWWWIPS